MFNNQMVERHYIFTKAELVKGLDSLSEKQKALFDLLVKNPYIEADDGTIYRMGVQVKSFINDDGEVEVGPDLYLEEATGSDIKEKLESLDKMISDIFSSESSES